MGESHSRVSGDSRHILAADLGPKFALSAANAAFAVVAGRFAHHGDGHGNGWQSLPVGRSSSAARVVLASGIAAPVAVDGLFAGTGAAERRKSAAMLDSEPAMNATGKRRQMELLGSSASSAMRCSSSKRNACQSKRRVYAVTASERPFRRDAARRSAGAAQSVGQNFPTGFSILKPLFFTVYAGLVAGFLGASEERPAATISPRSIAFLALSQESNDVSAIASDLSKTACRGPERRG